VLVLCLVVMAVVLLLQRASTVNVPEKEYMRCQVCRKKVIHRIGSTLSQVRALPFQP